MLFGSLIAWSNARTCWFIVLASEVDAQRTYNKLTLRDSRENASRKSYTIQLRKLCISNELALLENWKLTAAVNTRTKQSLRSVRGLGYSGQKVNVTIIFHHTLPTTQLWVRELTCWLINSPAFHMFRLLPLGSIKIELQTRIANKINSKVIEQESFPELEAFLFMSEW